MVLHPGLRSLPARRGWDPASLPFSTPARTRRQPPRPALLRPAPRSPGRAAAARRPLRPERSGADHGADGEEGRGGEKGKKKKL